VASNICQALFLGPAHTDDSLHKDVSMASFLDDMFDGMADADRDFGVVPDMTNFRR